MTSAVMPRAHSDASRVASKNHECHHRPSRAWGQLRRGLSFYLFPPLYSVVPMDNGDRKKTS
jgi:hypothetical protein